MLADDELFHSAPGQGLVDSGGGGLGPEGISRQEATIRAIHEALVRDASARARFRYAEVVDRLGR